MPGIHAVVGVASVDVGRSALAPASRRARAAAAKAVRPRPLGHPARLVVRTGLTTIEQRPVLRTGVATVAARVVRPVAHAGEATRTALVPVAGSLSHLPYVRRLPITSVAETLAGEGLRESAVTAVTAVPAAPRRVTAQPPPATSSASVATRSTELGVVRRAPTNAFALTRLDPAARAASASSGGDAPAQPGSPDGVPLPAPPSAGNCSATTDMALPASTPVLPHTAYERGLGRPCSSTSAPAKGPDNRPD